MIIHIPPGDLDQTLRNNRIPGTTFVLEEGTYTTQGGFAFESCDLCVLAPGCGLMGRGKDRTYIKVSNVDTKVGNDDARYSEVLTGGARTKGSSDSLMLEGFTLDLSAVKVPTVGIHLYTSRASVRDVAIVGVWGSRDWPGKVKEGFGLLINNAAEARVDGGHSVHGVEVVVRGTPGENYTTAVYVGCDLRINIPLLFSEVRHTKAVAVGVAHAGYGIGNNLIMVNCEAHGFIRAIFCDTESSQDVLINAFRGMGCLWAMDLRTVQEGNVRARILIEDSKFVFKDTVEYNQALRLEAADGSYISDVELRRCEFMANSSLTSKGRSNGNGVGPVTERACAWLTKPDGVPWQVPTIQSGAAQWLKA
jgi:hypothetical protein